MQPVGAFARNGNQRARAPSHDNDRIRPQLGQLRIRKRPVGRKLADARSLLVPALWTDRYLSERSELAARHEPDLQIDRIIEGAAERLGLQRISEVGDQF